MPAAVTPNAIRESLQEICYDVLQIKQSDPFTDDLRFEDDLGANSLDMVELVMAMEEEFNVDICDSDAESLKTVGDAVAYIEKASRQ